MLPNLRLSGTANDSLSDYLTARSAAAAVAAAASNNNKNNAAPFAPTVNRSFASSVSSSGWGPMLSSSSTLGSASFANTVGSGLQARTLAGHVKESTGWYNQTSASSMPWAAAVKAPLEHHIQEQQHHHSLLQQHSPASMIGASPLTAASSGFGGDAGNSIGSWTSPESSSSVRSGWNADGSMKSDGVPDDGTAIWGATKKTGIDWTEKEALLNPPQASNNSERRQPKPEPVISSINGTEAWGAPVAGNGGSSNKTEINNSQHLSENSGNNFVGKTTTINNEPLGWGESSSLQQAATKNGNSSPISNSVWNHLTAESDNNPKRKTSADWLSSSISSNNSARLDDLNKQLENTSLFSGDSNSQSSTSIMTRNSSSIKNNSSNPNLDISGRQSSASIVGGVNSAGAIGNLVGGVGGATGNAINDLKQQMSANFSTNDLLESSPNRQAQANILSSNNNNQTQSQLSSYSLGVTPSRELLKQMVQQIQLAVQAGHLNAHILNQPLSTPTLQLVYTLLQQIKQLQQLQEIQHRTRSVSKSNDIANNSAQQNTLELRIAQVQQNISVLQKAITQQQSALSKNESLVEANNSKLQHQQQGACNSSSSYNNSYANISKLSTNIKVPSNQSNMSNAVDNGNNIDSFRRSSLIDTLSNSNSDQLRSEAQARFEANANHDKNLSPILQSSASLNNILNNNKTNDFAKSQSSANNQQNASQKAKSNLLSSPAAQASSASAAWLAFTHGDMSNIQSDSTNGTDAWSRSPSNNEQSQYNNDILSEISSAKAWRGAPFLSSESRDNISSSVGTTIAPSSMAPGSNLARSSSTATSNNMKQMSENDTLNRDPSSLYYDWNSSNQTSDSIRRSLDTAQTLSSPSSSFSSAIGGLSLQSNPWLFAPNSSNSLNIDSSGLDNLIGGTKDDAKISKTDNNNTANKIRVGNNDHLGFLSSTNNSGGGGNNVAQRALYDWSDMATTASSLQFNGDNISVGSNKQTATAGLVSGPPGSRPGPPPGLMSNLGTLGTSSVNEISSILESSNNNGDKSTSGNNETQLPSRESSNSLWSGAWFD